MFKEVKFNPGVHILEEGNLMNEKFYLIADGHIRLESLKNPYRRREMNKKSLLKNVDSLHSIYDKSAGLGNLSHTFNKTNLGFVTKGHWVGEENCLLNGELPQIYQAICETSVKAFEVDKSDFIAVIP